MSPTIVLQVIMVVRVTVDLISVAEIAAGFSIVTVSTMNHLAERPAGCSGAAVDGATFNQHSVTIRSFSWEPSTLATRRAPAAECFRTRLTSLGAVEGPLRVPFLNDTVGVLLTTLHRV
jgi:hypothetical protein